MSAVDTPARRFDDVLPITIGSLSRGGIAASQAALPAAMRLFHHELLRLFLRTGRPPTVAQLTTAAQQLGLDPHEALAILRDVDLVHTDATGGRVAIAYPLSGRPSPHRVTTGDGVSVAAMCAVDALGIPLMTGDAATITSSDPTTGDPIHIRCDAEDWRWEPPTTVVVLAAVGGCRGPIANACAHTAFHATAEAARTYLAQRPTLTGRVLSQAEALDIAEAEFGPLLRPWDP